MVSLIDEVFTKCTFDALQEQTLAISRNFEFRGT